MNLRKSIGRLSWVGWIGVGLVFVLAGRPMAEPVEDNPLTKETPAKPAKKPKTQKKKPAAKKPKEKVMHLSNDDIPGHRPYSGGQAVNAPIGFDPNAAPPVPAAPVPMPDAGQAPAVPVPGTPGAPPAAPVPDAGQAPPPVAQPVPTAPPVIPQDPGGPPIMNAPQPPAPAPTPQQPS